MSGRTLARRFEAELGMSLRSWRRVLRLFKAIELLGGGLGVTQTAMEQATARRLPSRTRSVPKWAAPHFSQWCEAHGLAQLADVQPRSTWQRS
jgi:hypothetical protein